MWNPEVVAVVMLACDALFWYGSFRYYRKVSVELSQYAQSPIKSPSIRAGTVSLIGFGLATVFVLTCTLQRTYMSPYIMGNDPSFLPILIIFLSVVSPFFNCLALWSFSAFSGGIPLTLENAGAFLAYTSVFLVPSGYILYKTRKEIELRLQMAVGPPPKKLYDDFKRKGHGNPRIQGVFGAIRGLILFPVYMYYDLFKASRGMLTYEESKVVGSKTTREGVTMIRSIRRIKFDIADELESLDEETVGLPETPVCPKCKSPLIFLRDQEKFWCEKCKRARYVKSKT